VKAAAGGIPGDTPDTSPRTYADFEAQVLNELLATVVGRSPGEYKNVDLRLKPVSASNPREHDLHMALVRQREKEMRIPLSVYNERFDEAPQVGEELMVDPDIPGKIESVTDSEVIVKLQAQPGTVAELPFGKGT